MMKNFFFWGGRLQRDLMSNSIKENVYHNVNVCVNVYLA